MAEASRPHIKEFEPLRERITAMKLGRILRSDTIREAYETLSKLVTNLEVRIMSADIL
jgi:hypothetical protein